MYMSAKTNLRQTALQFKYCPVKVDSIRHLYIGLSYWVVPKSQLILVAKVRIVICYATLSAAQGDFCSKLRTTSSVAFHLSRMVGHKTTITIITLANWRC